MTSPGTKSSYPHPPQSSKRWLSPFPLGSSCLFSSLADSFSLGKPITSSSREKMFPPKFELTPTSKQPSTVVRPISQFGRHCCPGVSKPVPAGGDLSRPVPVDGDSRCPGSGSILPWVFPSIQTCTSNNISEQLDRGLQGWTVSIGVTTTCAAARPLLSMIMRSSLANSSSVRLTVPYSSSPKKFSTLWFDLSFSDIKISFINAFTPAHILAVVVSGVGGSGL